MALALTFTACDMDKTPYDAIPEEGALETPTDFVNMSVPLYTGLRSCVGSSAFYNGPDEQSDDFNAMFGTSVTDLYGWTFNTSLREGETMYANCQQMIARANFIIDGYNKCDMSNANLFTPAAMQSVRNVKGEAFFTRAYFLFYLAQFFCQDYDESIADNANSGVSYRTDYAPSSEGSTYPARKTLRETYKQITEDLDSAAQYINTPGSQSCYDISVDAVTAMQARVALAMDNYTEAARKAEEVINTQTYALINSADMMEDFWWGNFDTETIFKLFSASSSELPSQTGSSYLPYTEGGIPSFVPTQTVVDLYSENDYRKSVYFTSLDLQTSTGITGTVLALSKYPENGYVWESAGEYDYARFAIEPKVIRLSEMYLIAAEAYAMSNDITNGAKWLNDFERSRIADYQDQSFASAADLMEEIRNERQREFLGEGMRLMDLKRWHLGVTRGTPQQEDLCSMPGLPTTTELNKPADDMRFTWPIPQNEVDTNPQIVQNPGYARL